jgi:hypothetical protein
MRVAEQGPAACPDQPDGSSSLLPCKAPRGAMLLVLLNVDNDWVDVAGTSVIRVLGTIRPTKMVSVARFVRGGGAVRVLLSVMDSTVTVQL